jgi:hypothetical protein
MPLNGGIERFLPAVLALLPVVEPDDVLPGKSLEVKLRQIMMSLGFRVGRILPCTWGLKGISSLWYRQGQGLLPSVRQGKNRGTDFGDRINMLYALRAQSPHASQAQRDHQALRKSLSASISITVAVYQAEVRESYDTRSKFHGG